MVIAEVGLTSLVGIGATVGLFVTRFRSVTANKFMAKTGPLVKGVHVSRKTLQLPFQQIVTINMNPINYHFLGHNMSKELVPFELPLIFTVSPKNPETDLEGFIRYATRLGNLNHEEIKHVIGGIVNGETRGYVAGLTISEIFSNKESFTDNVVLRVQKDLEQFGLEIQNANIEEMHDTEGNSYFESLKKKALEEALTKSRIDVSEARKEGDIGEKSREVTTRKQKAIFEADAINTEAVQNQNISDYNRELALKTISNKQLEELASIDAYKNTENKKIIVEAELNKQKQAQELERLRSLYVIKATAEAEAIVKKANADSEAIKIEADAKLYAKTNEAEGVKKYLEAQANGLQRIYEISKVNPSLASFYLALDKGIFDPEGLFSVIADKQAHAIKGLEPKISIWNTGNSQDMNHNYTKIISDLAKSIPPIIDGIQNSTNIRLPDWSMNPFNSTKKMEDPEIESGNKENVSKKGTKPVYSDLLAKKSQHNTDFSFTDVDLESKLTGNKLS